MNAEQIADKIYDDLKQNVIEWASQNGKARYSPNGGYAEYPTDPENYIENLVEELSKELYDRFHDDKALSIGLYEIF